LPSRDTASLRSWTGSSESAGEGRDPGETMGQVSLLKRSDDSALGDFLASSDKATVYHTPEWRDVLVSTYGYEPLYVGHFENGALTAILPLMLVRSWLTGKRLVSLPFANTCGPVGSEDHVSRLLEKALELFHEVAAAALEIRTQADLNPVDDARFTGSSYFLTSVVDLDEDPTRVWKSFKDRNVRTEVRQAEKKGVEVHAGTSDTDLRRFYSLFASTRLGHGVPPQPFSFFRNLWRHLWPDHLDLLMATHQGRRVGALITLSQGSTLSAAYIGSDTAYRSHRVHQILFWKAMEMGCQRGLRTFDFLRTPKSSESLRYFKQRWNAREIDLNYLYYPEVRGTASTVEETAKYRLMTAVLRRSPGFMGRLLGRALYRHLG
jgi:CelD/BcsL family acetyltransferase involved in cellulose biosynthesis